MGFEINGYTKCAIQEEYLYSDLHTNVQDCFNGAGIEIMSPHYRAGRHGTQINIPESYLAKDYKAQPFNFNITKP